MSLICGSTPIDHHDAPTDQRSVTYLRGLCEYQKIQCYDQEDINPKVLTFFQSNPLQITNLQTYFPILDDCSFVIISSFTDVILLYNYYSIMTIG